MPDQAIPEILSSSNTSIDIDVPPEAKIEITNVKLNATPTNFRLGSFTIRNLSDKNLIAYNLIMNLYFDEIEDHPLEMGITEDGWFLNQYVLKPGESREGVIRMSLTAPTAVTLTRISVVPDYVEFSGEAALGSNRAMVGASLKKSRDIKAEVFQTYCAKLRSGESPESVKSLIMSDRKDVKTERQMAMSVLSTFLDEHGGDGFATVCSEGLQARAY